MPATQTAATPTITISLANQSGDRAILRNGVLVGHCYKTVAAYCGCRGRRDSWWVVTNVFGHCHRTQTPTLADVRAEFA